MRCRAILSCKVERNSTEQCTNEAAYPLTTGGSPALCWVHQQALTNAHRIKQLELAPLSQADFHAQHAARAKQ